MIKTNETMERFTKMACPVCGADINVEEALGQKYQQEFRIKTTELENAVKKRESLLAQKEQSLKEQQTALEQQIAQKVAEQTKTEIAKQKQEILRQAENKIKSDYEIQLKSLAEAESETKKKLQELQNTALENARLKRLLDSQKQDTALEIEKKLAENDETNRKKFEAMLKAEAEIISKREAERQEEKVSELQKQLADAKKAAEEAARKADQRSQQLLGEIQELAVEEFLRETFPFDEISEVKKGQYGADAVQVVRNSFGNVAGTILYESKNTENYSKDWIEKMKAEAADSKADLLVLVTKAMPKGMEHTDYIDGVWVCPIKEFQGTARVLRDRLIRVSEAYASQTNKADRVQMLYDYLTNGNFVDQVKRVVTGFNELRDGYEKEKKAMQSVWKKRDAQIEMMMKNTIDFVTQIQIIGGSALPQLESPEEDLLTLGNS
ncbi:MAG: DUF2130 domain-containing protein [Planctomycetaceae bacterium]|nr:DUF2130 domain-containing protein [Planctomycetaceae bacterium]